MDGLGGLTWLGGLHSESDPNYDIHFVLLPSSPPMAGRSRTRYGRRIQYKRYGYFELVLLHVAKGPGTGTVVGT